VNIENIVIRLFFEGQEIVPGKEGFVSGLHPGRATLVVEVPQESWIFAIDVDGKKNVNQMKDHASGTCRRYRARIQIKESNWKGQRQGDVVFHTEYPNNNLRLVEWLGWGFCLWEISLISQNGAFFLVKELQYEVPCEMKNGHVSCGRFDEEWPQLTEFIKKVANASGDISMLGSWKPVDENPQEIPRGFHRVKWWNASQGLGCIETPGGTMARVHWTQVRPREGSARRYLIPGELVRVKCLTEVRQLPGRRPSAFKMEARGVSV